MLVELLHVVASRTEVLAWVEFSWLLSEYLADSCGHCKTAVGVDVDFANCALCCLAELLLWNTDCIGKLATELVDGVNLVLRNLRRTVKNDWEAGKLSHYSVENVECQWRRNKLTLLVACALLGSELVGTVRSTD